MVVDSCRHPISKTSVALDFLRARGVNLSTQVKLIVLTHWHDDHIAGARELVNACDSATVVFSQAMTSSEFAELVNLYGDTSGLPAPKKRSLVEFRGIVEILKDRKAKGLPRYLVLGKADTVLFKSDECEVHCLSPSDDAVVKATAEFAKMVPKYMRQRVVLHAKHPNHNSVALWVNWVRPVQLDLLLGADLEMTADKNMGWDGVLKTVAIKGRKASVVKVPHHGSITGHSPDLWANHVIEKSTGIVTTFNRGKSPLPTTADVARLKALCATLISTTLPKSAPPKREPTVERTLKEVVTFRATVHENYGQISIRQGLNGSLSYNLTGANIL